MAGRSNVERQLNQRFIDSITPLVKQAVERSVSAMVVSGLSGKNSAADEQTDSPDVIENTPVKEFENIIDPDNPNIITTKNEPELYDKIKAITNCDDIQYKDTESYFGILYQEKTNRWIVRYYDKTNAFILVPIEITDILANEVARAGLELNNGRISLRCPEDILRITGIILDSFEYVKNDENFLRKKQS